MVKVVGTIFTELHGSTQKKFFKLGETARTYKWGITIGKRPIRKKERDNKQLILGKQTRDLGRIWRNMGIRDKQPYINMARERQSTPFAEFVRHVTGKGYLLYYAYNECPIIEAIPDDNYTGDSYIYVKNKTNDQIQTYIYIYDKLLRKDIDPNKCKLYMNLWYNGEAYQEEITLQLYRMLEYKNPWVTTWNNPIACSTIPTDEVTINGVPHGEDLEIPMEFDISEDIKKLQTGEIEHLYGWKIKAKYTYDIEKVNIMLIGSYGKVWENGEHIRIYKE